jgi:hypothetical protein
VPPPARRARSVGGRRVRGVVLRVPGVVVVVAAALDAAAEEARGDGERKKQSNGGPGGELHCRSRSNYVDEEINSGSWPLIGENECEIAIAVSGRNGESCLGH